MKPRFTLFFCSLLILLGCQPDAARSSALSVSAPDLAVTSEDLVGVWRLIAVGDALVVENSPARIQFTEEGDLNGNASCNRFFGKYSYTGAGLVVLEPLGATKMMCLPALMEQETRLLSSLPRASRVDLDAGILVLKDLEGRVIARAVPDPQF